MSQVLANASGARPNNDIANKVVLSVHGAIHSTKIAMSPLVSMLVFCVKW